MTSAMFALRPLAASLRQATARPDPIVRIDFNDGVRRLLPLIVLLASVASGYAAPYCRVTSETAVLGNAQLKREWVRRDGVWSTSSLSRADGTATVAVPSSAEFSVAVYEGATSSGASCAWSAPTSQVNSRQASLTFTAQDAATGLRIAVRCWLRGDEPLMRKNLTITGPADTVIGEVAVESLATPAAAARGGYGQPIFLGDAWYTGLEYPAGYNDLSTGPEGRTLLLHHYPGRTVGAGLVSKTAVLGVAPAGLSRELAFSDYLGTIRIPCTLR
eukprot:TRINITY_DN19365_c0_g1_i1.p3 TRINITY_DN19365_c0_g1~~TRINITY_DN19365_c0_g1_i1.p3  ORF type:complete len:274 (-),score=20.87 TRINITY_DN19365_c0_g1_i1:3-824(-)